MFILAGSLRAVSGKVDVDVADFHVKMKATGNFFKVLRQDFSWFPWARCKKDIYQKYVRILTDIQNGLNCKLESKA